MARDLTKLEREFYQVLCQQIEDERPHRVMCPLADRFIKLFRAYELKKKNEKERG